MDLLIRRLRGTVGMVGVLWLAILVPSLAAAQVFSPGPLARPHKSLEGLENCEKCHVKGEQLAASRCLDCHTEIDSRLTGKRGFHGRLEQQTVNTCWTCHPEHKGLNFSLINWGPGGNRAFAHETTGWPLLGAHAKTACEKCHQKPRVTDPEILSILGKYPLRTTFLGVSPACTNCHFDEHRGQVGTLCKTCHDEKAWQPVPMFDHGEDTNYPLEGKHKKVKCAECHPTLTDTTTAPDASPAPKSKTFLQYSGIEHSSCLNCHEDPHEGRFGDDCEECHTVQGWDQVRTPSKDRAFHDETRFPLKGDHRNVACEKCHGPWPGQKAKFKGLVFGRCADCHPDAHLRQLPEATATRGQTCDSCHTEEGFTPTTFPLARHEKTRYPLTGAHVVVSCGECHVQEPLLASRIPEKVKRELARKKRQQLFSFALFDFKQPLGNCETCHEDVHGGQLKKQGGCAGCHVTTSWAKLTFDHDKESRFPLTGKHAKAACGSCHVPGPKEGGVSRVRYKPLPIECNGCHTDIHVGQLAEKPNAPTTCERCHTTEDFKRTLFRHEPPFTQYLLDGRHQKVECQKCHPVISLGRGRPGTARYKPLPQNCAGCHEDPHHGAFDRFAP